MLDHEIYQLTIAALKKLLREAVEGEVSITKDDHTFYISIYNRGYWNYKIYDVDRIDWNDLSARKMADDVLRWHKARLISTFFKA